MAVPAGKRTMTIVTACMNANGSPAFALNCVEVDPEEIANGIHYYLVEAELMEAGYEEPFCHFDEDEAPQFLHAAVRQHLGLPATAPIPSAHSEDARCLVSSK